MPFFNKIKSKRKHQSHERLKIPKRKKTSKICNFNDFIKKTFKLTPADKVINSLFSWRKLKNWLSGAKYFEFWFLTRSFASRYTLRSEQTILSFIQEDNQLVTWPAGVNLLVLLTKKFAKIKFLGGALKTAMSRIEALEHESASLVATMSCYQRSLFSVESETKRFLSLLSMSSWKNKIWEYFLVGERFSGFHRLAFYKRKRRCKICSARKSNVSF